MDDNEEKNWSRKVASESVIDVEWSIDKSVRESVEQRLSFSGKFVGVKRVTVVVLLNRVVLSKSEKKGKAVQ